MRLTPQATLPSAPVEGELAILDAANLLSYYDGSDWQNVSPLVYRIAADSTVIDGATAGLQNFSNGAYTIPANTLRVGSVIRVRMLVFVSAFGASTNNDVVISIDGAATAGQDPRDTAPAGSQVLMQDLEITVRTLGASGTFRASSWVTDAAGATINVINTRGGAVGTIDTTAGIVIQAAGRFTGSPPRVERRPPARSIRARAPPDRSAAA